MQTTYAALLLQSDVLIRLKIIERERFLNGYVFTLLRLPFWCATKSDFFQRVDVYFILFCKKATKIAPKFHVSNYKCPLTIRQLQ